MVVVCVWFHILSKKLMLTQFAWSDTKKIVSRSISIQAELEQSRHSLMFEETIRFVIRLPCAPFQPEDRRCTR